MAAMNRRLAAVVLTLAFPLAPALEKATGMQPSVTPDRLPPIPEAQMTDAQRKAVDEFKVIRNGADVSVRSFRCCGVPS